MLDFYSLLEISELRAIYLAIDPTVDYIWRMKCREYSEKFYTPLHVVVNELDPDFVLQSLYEDKYSPKDTSEDIEGTLDVLYKMKDPNYSKLSAQQTEDFVDAALNKLNKFSKKKEDKKPVGPDKAMAKKTSEIAKKPKSGSMDFKELEKIDSENESGATGFKE